VVSFAIDSYHAGSLRHAEILAPGRRAGNYDTPPNEVS
jgi:hypothetical protein